MNRASKGDCKEIMFQYNGHSFEAFKALGIEPCLDKELIKKSYENCLNSVDVQSQPFLEAAMNAILSQVNKISG